MLFCIWNDFKRDNVLNLNQMSFTIRHLGTEARLSCARFQDFTFLLLHICKKIHINAARCLPEMDFAFYCASTIMKLYLLNIFIYHCVFNIFRYFHLEAQGMLAAKGFTFYDDLYSISHLSVFEFLDFSPECPVYMSRSFFLGYLQQKYFQIFPPGCPRDARL